MKRVRLHCTCMKLFKYMTLQNNTASNSVTQYDWQQEIAYEHVDRLTFSNTNSIMCLKRLMDLCKFEIQTQLVHVKTASVV
jgi:hypothetical protein